MPTKNWRQISDNSLLCTRNLFKNHRKRPKKPEKWFSDHISPLNQLSLLKFGTLMHNSNILIVIEPGVSKKVFPGENAGNMPEITVFWTFLKILTLVFCDFLLKDAY